MRDHLGEREDLRILSFGCSTGEEVVTLRRYFPAAHLVGSEVNARRLEICRARKLDQRISFVGYNRQALAQSGLYDAVFCMAVLQRRPHHVIRSRRKDISDFYPFSQFDEEISFLVSILKPGGLLAVAHSQYLVRDASAGGHLAPLPGFFPTTRQGPRFDPNGHLLEAFPGETTLFLKLGTKD